MKSAKNEKSLAKRNKKHEEAPLTVRSFSDTKSAENELPSGESNPNADGVPSGGTNPNADGVPSGKRPRPTAEPTEATETNPASSPSSSAALSDGNPPKDFNALSGNAPASVSEAVPDGNSPMNSVALSDGNPPKDSAALSGNAPASVSEAVSDGNPLPPADNLAGKTKKTESKKKKWAKRILLIAVFAFTFYAMYLMATALNGGEIASLGQIFQTADLRFLTASIALAILLLFFDAFKYSILSRMTVGRFRYGACLTAGIVGKFYDNITPFAAGGQPFQMVHFSKKDYPTGVATAIPTLKYIIQLYVYIAVSVILYIANPTALDYLDPTSKGIIQSACYVGLVFAVSAPSFFVFFSVAPKAADKVVCFFLKILCKLKIVKNFDETHKKVFLFVIGYQTAFKQLSKKYGGIVFLVLFCVIDCLLYFALPYFLLVAMGGASPGWKLMLDVATLNSYSFFAASLIPTPGNSGAIEASYSMVFAPVAVASGTLFWIVFLWRFLTYYSYIFIGLAYNLSAFVHAKVKARKTDSRKTESAEDTETEVKKLRVLEVLDSYSPNFDGTIELINNYAKCLNEKEGVECEILVPKYPKTKIEQPFPVHRAISMSGCGFGVRLPLPFLDVKVKRYLRKTKFDVVHAHSPVTIARFARNYARKHDVPILFTMHTKYREEINRSVPIPFLQNFAMRFIMNTIRRMDYVYAVSEGAAECLKSYGFKGEIGILKNGTDLVYPEKDMSAEIAELRGKYGLNGVDSVFLFVGRIVVVKKIQNLLRVAAELKKRGTSFKLLIVGDGDYMKELKKLTVELDIADVVVFTGKILNRETLSAHYLLSDLFLFPSTFDTFGLVALEAAAMKLPSLLVKNCAAAEIVTDGRNGFVAEETTEAWADKIQTIMSDKVKLAEIKENCYREVYRSWAQATDEALEIYRRRIEDYKNLQTEKEKTRAKR